MTDTEVKTETNGQSATVTKSGDENAAKHILSAEELECKIVRQIEHYFGDYNLPRDKFLKETIKADDGWVPMETMLNFQRLAALSTDAKIIMAALKKGGSGLMEVDEDNQKIRRCPTVPLPEWNDARREELMNSTVYVKGFEKTQTSLDDLLSFFGKFPNVLNVTKRLYEDRKDPERKKHFKGSVFVVFKDKESAQNFMDLDSLKSPDDKEELIRKWQKDYLDEKDKEFEDKKKQRREEKQSNKKAKEFAKTGDTTESANGDGVTEKENFELPLGSVLHLQGFAENGDTKREDIKDKLVQDFEMDASSIAFVYYNKGETNAKLRFQEENAAKKLADVMKEKLGDKKFLVKDTEIEFKVLEGDEESKFLEQCKKDIAERKFQGKKSHKRRGGFGGGRGGKRQRTR